MKTGRLIVCLILTLTVLVFVGGSAAEKEPFVPGEDEEICGTWINTDYGTGMKDQKRINYPDGRFERFHYLTNTHPSLWGGTYTLEDKWTDPEGNIWYKRYCEQHTGIKDYTLDKISNSGRTWEFVSTHVDYPTEMDPNYWTYCIYYREEQEKLAVKNEAQASEHKPKVLLFIRKGICHDIELMLTQEVGVMTSMLEEAGFEVTVATASGEPIEAQTTKLMPDLELADVKVNDYVGIIMPCMAKPDWQASPEEILLVKEAVAQGKPIAAQYGAIFILAEAGVLVGKKYTYYFDPSWVESFEGAIYSGKGVIQDGNIITSANCPYAARYYGRDDGTSELTKLFIETIKD